MSKTIENVAKALASSHYLDFLGGTVRGCNDQNALNDYIEDGWDDFAEEAQVALEAVGVLVLPHDAEPMVGDVIEYIPTCYKEMRFGLRPEVGRVYNCAGAGLAVPNFLLKDCESIKIISRKGYNAVIHEEKDDE